MPEPRRQRLCTAPLLVLAVAAASFALYEALPPTVAGFFFIPYAALLAGAPLVVYPRMRSCGAGTARATAGALSVLGAWLVKECYCVARIFGAAKAAYYAANPIALGLFSLAAFEMGAAELVMRRIGRGRWQLMSGAGIVVAAVVLAGVAFSFAARKHGATVAFDAYMALYRQLFPQ